MKIIFLKEVPRVGRKYEVKEVAPGYGRHLLASKLAELATKDSLARIEKKMLVDATQKKVHEDLLLKNLEALNGTTITLARKSNAKGHLFASIHKSEILEELKRATRLEMHPDYILLDKPIKELGTREVSVTIGKHHATFRVVVEALK